LHTLDNSTTELKHGEVVLEKLNFDIFLTFPLIIFVPSNQRL